ncbi:MAG TPA: hypothetical protein VMV47_10970 [Bacteroidales bacterium]|nr:hypothetical protein [Bacteroidales bacterium]
MRTLIFFVTVVILTFSVSGQSEYSSNKGKPPKTQEELNQSLITAKTVKGTGTVIALTGVGLLVASIVKGAQLDKEYGAVDPPPEENAKWAGMVLGGCALTTIGLGTRIAGKVKVKKIEAELVKFQGSAVGYGIGLKIRF